MAKEKTYVEVTTTTAATRLTQRIELAPIPETIEYSENMFPFPKHISVEGLDFYNPLQTRTVETFKSFIESLSGVTLNKQEKGLKIKYQKSKKNLPEEAYSLEVTAKGVDIQASSDSGFFYATQTLIQILASAYYVGFFLGTQTPAEKDAYTKRYIPEVKITDKPQYKLRSFMVDLGRATFSLSYLKRIVRIMAQLKLNTLHLHIFDDQLCGVRWNKLPIGHENPYSLTMSELADLINYAKTFHVAVMPELESWGHVQSILYHYPELYGCEGMWGGMSFGIGQKTYQLLSKIYDEIVEIIDHDAMVHVGLDEARWQVLKGEKNKGHNPTNMVQKVYSLLQASAKKHKKNITMHLWADHGGRPLPKNIANKLVIEPWKYRHNDEERIIKTMTEYGGLGKTSLMMGAGWSSIHAEGSYEATRIWANEGMKYPNVLGVTCCMWESNNLSNQMIGLYGGACYSWNPLKPANNPSKDPHWEDVRCRMVLRMRRWQQYFKDALPEILLQEQGEEVYQGRFASGSRIGQVVAPTVDFHLRFKP